MPAPGQTLERKESLDRLRRAILDLREEEKEVFLLRQNGELTYEQIAELRSMPGQHGEDADAQRAGEICARCSIRRNRWRRDGLSKARAPVLQFAHFLSTESNALGRWSNNGQSPERAKQRRGALFCPFRAEPRVRPKPRALPWADLLRHLRCKIQMRNFKKRKRGGFDAPRLHSGSKNAVVHGKEWATMKCESCRQQMLPYLYDLLEPPDRAELAAHRELRRLPGHFAGGPGASRDLAEAIHLETAAIVFKAPTKQTPASAAPTVLLSPTPTAPRLRDSIAGPWRRRSCCVFS